MKKILTFALVLALAFCLTACDKKDETIKIGASPAPHAEILEVIKPLLEKEGVGIEIVEFTDYTVQNKALSSGDVYANFFQHTPYLESYNENSGDDLVAAVKVHFEPMGVYSERVDSIENIPENAKVAIPNDETNERRALELLESLGLITLKNDKSDLTAVGENYKSIEIVELAAEQIPRGLADVDIAVVNGNYAVSAGILDKALTYESADSKAADTFANVLAVRNEDKDSEITAKIAEALTSKEVKDFLEEKYAGQCIAVFE